MKRYDPTKQRRGRAAENLVLSKIKDRGYSAELLPGLDDGWGNELAQMIVLKNGFETICPDIVVYEDVWEDEIIFRVEVKSYYQLDEGCVYIRENQFKKYIVLQSMEEVEIRVVFVIGEFETGEEEYYWIRLTDLQNVKYKRNVFGEKKLNWKLEDIKNSGYTGFGQF